MRALHVVAAILCVALLAIPTLVIVRAASAASFRWTGTDEECPIVEGAGSTRCLGLRQAFTLATLVAASALGLAGLARGRPVLVRAAAYALVAGMVGTLAYRAALGQSIADDLLAALPPLAVASVLLLAGRAGATTRAGPA